MIVDHLENRGISWKAYMESIDTPCSSAITSGVAPHIYAKKHNPFLYFDQVTTNATQCNKVVPLTQLDIDILNGELPRFTFITPDLCSDTHDCAPTAGDDFLRVLIPKLMATPNFDNSLLAIFYDEGLSTLNGGGRTIFVVISEVFGKKNFVSSATNYNHYNLLRTLLNAWDLPENLGAAADATLMTEFFLVTPSITPSHSLTSSITPSNSLTPSITPSNSLTPSITPSHTITPSITQSLSHTPSITKSITPSVSMSVDPSFTPSPSGSQSQTPSNSVDESLTKIPTRSRTSSHSAVPTKSPSSSFTSKPSNTRSTSHIVCGIAKTKAACNSLSIANGGICKWRRNRRRCKRIRLP
jgi:hypothetical protein